LRPLGSTGEGVPPSACSNVIGVSTLIVSKDNFVYLTQQSSQNIQSAGLVAPSGSGSVDFADLGKIGSEGTLIDLVKYAARRESLEEGGLPLDVSEQFNQVPLGFARMLHVGAKPEFFCFGKVQLKISEINGRRAYSKKEGLFTKDNFNVDHALLLENINDFRESWFVVSRDIRKTIGAKISMPLELILLFMDDAMKHEEQAQKLLQLLRQN
jgi:8-oxo-dGTP pyrophosphatase MutT (NUDIX family)